MKEAIFSWSLKIKYPAIMVKMKLIPADTGMTKVKFAADNALNITKADTNITTKAPMTCIFSKNWIQSVNAFNTLPFSFHFMIAAPDTFSKA